MDRIKADLTGASRGTQALLLFAGAALYFLGKNAHCSSSSSSSSSKAVATAGAACVDIKMDFDLEASLPDSDDKVFEIMFARLRKEIVADLASLYELPADAAEYVDRMIDYNCWGGKMNRGLSVMSVQRDLSKHSKSSLSIKQRMQAAALGWCIEFLQAFFLVADDVMDGSTTRRGQPCWFRREEVKMVAINDSFILESCVFKILKRYFGRETYYLELVELFIEVTRQTEVGQLLDLTSQPQTGPIDLGRFTEKRYFGIVTYKTAFYSFYLPVALGLIISGVTDRSIYNQAREILVTMGAYFQVQDDYLDCYGAPEKIGKIGTDIQDNKCSWLVCQALNRSTPEQREVLIQNYGKHDEESVQRVKALYREMDIASIFHAYEEKVYQELKGKIAAATQVPPSIFNFLLDKIYKREK